MKDEKIIQLDIILSKLGYAMASLSSYNLLDLSKRTLTLHKQLELLEKTYIDKKSYIDIRDVIKFRNELKEFENNHLKDDARVSLQGHKLACLFFELSSLIDLFNLKYEDNEDYKEFLSLSSKYLYDCGRIINIEIIYYEEKI